VLSRTDLAYYSGDDAVNLPLWSVGALGAISVTGHVVGDRIHEMLDAFTAGRTAVATKLHQSMLPVNVGLFRNQAAVLTKAAMDMLGLPGGGVRGPLLPATDDERRQLREDLTGSGVKLPDLARLWCPVVNGALQEPRPARWSLSLESPPLPTRRHDSLRTITTTLCSTETMDVTATHCHGVTR
jgi:hypothetical protein